ncbi:MAG: PTS sugar transporter subunit IIA [Erysipelotrichaceae bacterium]
MSILPKFCRSGESFLIPFDGRIADISETPDPAFAQKLMGEGFVLFPSSNELFAPCTGIVEYIFPTKHAIGLQSDCGTEVLIHVGIDTVKLAGVGFEVMVHVGQRVQAGELLMRFDYDATKAALPSLATPIVFTALGERSVIAKCKGQVKAKNVMAVVK